MSSASAPSSPLLGAERVVRRAPVNLVPADTKLFAHEYAKDFGSLEALTLRSVRLLPNGFLVRGLKPLPESFVNLPRGLRRAKVALRTLQYGLSSPPRAGLGRALIITDEHSNGFFHWICDVLPRLEVLAAEAPAELAERTLVVPAMADFPYVLPSLAPYGLKPPRILGSRESAVSADLLVVPGAAPTGNYRPALMRALRERYRTFFRAEAPGRRLFISRAEAPRRRIANEEELLPLLDRHGFERVVLERLSLDEQVRLTASASVLVGSHGAGLTHLAWMSPGTRCLELRRRGDAENNCYFSLASALDIEYFYLACDAVDPRQGTHVADLIVKPGEFDRALAALLA